MAINDEKYMLLTTYRKDGTPVSSPVWVVDLADGTIGFWTSSGSGKAKRLANSERVTVQACDVRGRPKKGSSPLEGTAKLVTGPQYETIVQKVHQKYGFTTKITKFLQKVGNAFKGKKIPYGDRGVIVTLAG
jgi:uncharacterized protein